MSNETNGDIFNNNKFLPWLGHKIIVWETKYFLTTEIFSIFLVVSIYNGFCWYLIIFCIHFNNQLMHITLR